MKTFSVSYALLQEIAETPRNLPVAANNPLHQSREGQVCRNPRGIRLLKIFCAYMYSACVDLN